MFVDSAYSDALHAHPLISQPVLDVYLELTHLLLINAASAPVNARPVLMQPPAKPAKWVMSFQVRPVLRSVASPALLAMLLEDV